MNAPQTLPVPTPASAKALKALKTRLVAEGTATDWDGQDFWLAEAVLANGNRAFVYSAAECGLRLVNYSAAQLAVALEFGRLHVQGETEAVVLIKAASLKPATLALTKARTKPQAAKRAA